MEVRLKHNEFRDLVNELRDTADRYGGTDQLRDQLSHTLARRVRPVPDIVKMRPVLERSDRARGVRAGMREPPGRAAYARRRICTVRRSNPRTR